MRRQTLHCETFAIGKDLRDPVNKKRLLSLGDWTVSASPEGLGDPGVQVSQVHLNKYPCLFIYLGYSLDLLGF